LSRPDKYAKLWNLGPLLVRFPHFKNWTFWPLSIEFISETLRDTGNMGSYFWMLSPQSTQRKKTCQN